MKHLFIPYELAIIAKKKGFPNNTGSCLAAWEVNDKAEWLHFGSHPIGLIQAPIYQQIIDWFDENGIDIEKPKKYTLGYLSHIYKDECCTWQGNYFITKKDAYDAAIKHAFSLLP